MADKNYEELLKIENKNQKIDDPQFAQIYNGDSYVNPKTGKSFAEEIYPNADEDVACLGTD